MRAITRHEPIKKLLRRLGIAGVISRPVDRRLSANSIAVLFFKR